MFDEGITKQMLPFVGIDCQALPANIEEFSLQLARKRSSDKS